MTNTYYIGLDVHKDSVAIAHALRIAPNRMTPEREAKRS